MARTRTRTLGESEENGQKAALVANRRQRAAEIEDDEIEEFDESEEGEDSAVSTRKGRPTPSSSETKARGIGSTGLVNRIPVVRSVVAYFRGVVSEMQKVTWPTRDETRRLTTIVLIVMILFAIALGAMDSFLSYWFHQAFHANSEGSFLLIGLAVFAVIVTGYFSLRNRI